MDEARITWAAARRNVDMTQEFAAKALGISVQTLSSYEGYKTFPDAPMISDMCKLYKRDPSLIFLTKDAN